MRACWGADDAPPPRRCCQCAICDGDDGIEMQIQKAASAEVHDSFRCARRESTCEECAAKIKEIDAQDLRESVGCEMAGASAQVREWARRYQHVEAGWLDPMAAPMPTLEVAEIGDRVTSQAEADQIDAARDDSG